MQNAPLLCLDNLSKEPLPITPGSGAAMKALHFRRSWKHCGESPATVSLKQSVYVNAPAYNLILSEATKTHTIITSGLKTGTRKEEMHEKNIMDRSICCIFSFIDLCRRPGKTI
jgi:hypothetical protein